jgi:8-oxo-dGTP pyrophosphatase MutT (NUDIX family)
MFRKSNDLQQQPNAFFCDRCCSNIDRSNDRQMAMIPYQQQIDLVQRALAHNEQITIEELLFPRDREGVLARKLHPDAGVIPREAAALLLFYPQDDELWFPLTVRSSALPMHRGEVSLPGGAIDPEDEGPVAAALRETHEEIGIEQASIEIAGILTPLYIPPSNFRLTPVVGFAFAPPVLVPNPDEIADVFSVSLHMLLDGQTVQVEEWTLHGMQAQVPFFALQGHKVWGATAIVLSELVARIRRVLAAC